MTDETGPAPPRSRSEWARRREARSRDGWLGAAVGLGTLLAMAGLVLGLLLARRGSVLAGSGLAVVSGMLWLLVVMVGVLVAASSSRE